jgi:hypothetical protein
MPLRTSAASVIALLLAFPLCAQAPAESRAASRPAVAVHGAFAVEQGVRTLRLWGSSREMGFAHGYLLAEEIVPFLDQFVVNLPFVVGVERYRDRVVPFVEKKMAFTPAEEEELAGIVDGIKAKLGPGGARIQSLDREIAVVDLKAGNTFGDWAAFACSSFSVWGAATVDGGTLTARNFDYFPHPKLEQLVTLIARAPADPAARRWVTVGYPGLIGVISGMNEEGVGLFVHDVMPKPATEKTGIAPRLLALRRALEATGAENAVRRVHERLRDTTTHMGNNVQTTSPFDGKAVPAAIVEYDGVETLNGGADLRLPADGATYVLCSNHYRSREEPSRCGRYSKIEAALKKAAAEGRKLGPADARAIMATATQNSIGSKTLHTVVFQPELRRFELMLSGGGKVAPKNEPTVWTLDALLPPRPSVK